MKLFREHLSSVTNTNLAASCDVIFPKVFYQRLLVLLPAVKRKNLLLCDYIPVQKYTDIIASAANLRLLEGESHDVTCATCVVFLIT